MYSSVSLGSYFYLPIFVAVRNMKEEKIMTTMELEEADEVMTKEELVAELKEAFRYAKLVKEGKAKGRPAREVLDEL